MESQHLLPLATILGLGAFHGINPGMGWLFAVALGMQERRRSGVLTALLPLGLGHALAVAVALAVALLVGAIVPLQYLRWIVAGILIPLGIRCMYRHRHPRWASMRVGMGRLTLWSFLMASAHGAGLMVVPVFLGMSASPVPMTHQHHGNMFHGSAPAPALASPSVEAATPGAEASMGRAPGPATALFATSVHAVGYLIVTALIALLVYEKLGLELLRKAWFNLDLLWAAALFATGLGAIFI
jgi:hypothetical protein